MFHYDSGWTGTRVVLRSQEVPYAHPLSPRAECRATGGACAPERPPELAVPARTGCGASGDFPGVPQSGSRQCMRASNRLTPTASALGWLATARQGCGSDHGASPPLFPLAPAEIRAESKALSSASAPSTLAWPVAAGGRRPSAKRCAGCAGAAWRQCIRHCGAAKWSANADGATSTRPTRLLPPNWRTWPMWASGQSTSRRRASPTMRMSWPPTASPRSALATPWPATTRRALSRDDAPLSTSALLPAWILALDG